jgi:hypothetical protein
MSDSDKNCKNCLFYNNNKCHRFPPQVVFDSDPPGCKVTYYPEVSENDHCGEFKNTEKTEKVYLYIGEKEAFKANAYVTKEKWDWYEKHLEQSQEVKNKLDAISKLL